MRLSGQVLHWLGDDVVWVFGSADPSWGGSRCDLKEDVWTFLCGAECWEDCLLSKSSYKRISAVPLEPKPAAGVSIAWHVIEEGLKQRFFPWGQVPKPLLIPELSGICFLTTDTISSKRADTGCLVEFQKSVSKWVRMIWGAGIMGSDNASEIHMDNQQFHILCLWIIELDRVCI